MTRKYSEELERKRVAFREQTGTRKALITTLIAPYGLKANDPASHAVDKSLSLDSLFK